MTLFTRANQPLTLLPSNTPTSPQQPGSLEQLLVYGGSAGADHFPNANGVAFKIASPITGESVRQTLDYSAFTIMQNISGDYYAVGSYCIPLHEAFLLGGAPVWAFAKNIPGSAEISGGYKA